MPSPRPCPPRESAIADAIRCAVHELTERGYVAVWEGPQRGHVATVLRPSLLHPFTVKLFAGTWATVVLMERDQERACVTLPLRLDPVDGRMVLLPAPDREPGVGIAEAVEALLP
jgi:hypothetical protein